MSQYTLEILQEKFEAFFKREKEMLDKYNKNLSLFISKSPSKLDLKKYKLELINKDNSTQLFKCNDFVITEKFSFQNIFYSLSNNEILSILNYYNITKLNINILHYKLVNIQAFTNGENLTLKISSDLAITKMNKNERTCNLFVLLHEISHILGNMSHLPHCEPEADRFAAQELLKWEKVINLDE